MSLTRIGSIGINTGIAFAGVTTIVTLNTANDALSIGATVNVGSGITLGASGDIFATGVSTVTTLKVGSGVTVSSDGDVFATGVTTSTTFSGAFSGSGANITALNASNISSGTVPTARLGSGTASSSTFLRGDSTFQTVNTDLVSDTSPQLGGNLASNGNEIVMADDDKIKIGASSDLQLYHQSSNNTSYIQNTSDTDLSIINDGTNIYIKSSNGEKRANFIKDGAVELYHDNELQALTAANGLRIKTAGDTDTELSVVGPEGRSGVINLEADDGDDNADIWRMLAGTDGIFYLQNYTSGSYENTFKATGNGTFEIFHDNVKKLDTISTGIRVHGSEGGDAQIQLLADEGDDNADYWRFVGGTGGGLDIASYSSGSWVNHVSVNPDGEVQKPNNPAASVWTSSNEQGGHSNEVSSGYLKNGNETFDVSNDHGLSNNIGRFTCPVDGRYRVSFFTNVSVDGLTGDAFNINVRRNGSDIHLHYDQKEASSWQYIAFSDLINCSANDYLEIWLKAGNGSSQGTIGVDGSNSQWNSTFYELVA